MLDRTYPTQPLQRQLMAIQTDAHGKGLCCGRGVVSLTSPSPVLFYTWFVPASTCCPFLQWSKLQHEARNKYGMMWWTSVVADAHHWPILTVLLCSGGIQYTSAEHQNQQRLSGIRGVLFCFDPIRLMMQKRTWVRLSSAARKQRRCDRSAAFTCRALNLQTTESRTEA